MARAHLSEDSDSDLPDLDEIIHKHVNGLRLLHATKLDAPKAVGTKSSPRKTTKALSTPQLIEKKPSATTKSSPKNRQVSDSKARATEENQKKPQRPRQKAPPPKEDKPKLPAKLEASTEVVPRRKRRLVSYREAHPDLETEESDDSSKTDDEESILCDDDQDQKPRALTKPFSPIKRRGQTTPHVDSSDSDEHVVLQPRRKEKQRSPEIQKPAKTTDDLTANLLRLGLDSSSDKENDDRAVLRFSPPRIARPILERPATPPPASPSKSRLVSPLKKKFRVPTPPHAPHIDEFWNVHAVNDWNDQYSPQKPLLSPKKNRNAKQDDSDSPLSSPKKNQSPSKRSRAVMDAKKDFESRKHQLCEDFFQELDTKITEGKINELAAATGGVTFIWSKTLNTTAGRANWRRETNKKKNLDGSTTVTQRHHASIELAEKVIDDEERLLNVVAHEFCHLANFMVSGIKDQPHGQQFKAWGRKCSQAFSHRGIEVTTKHSYHIDYKYIWTCTNEACAQEFKRHSKSIDPARHSCGVCRAKLSQTKPVPRKQNGVTGYAAFVKEHFAVLKQDMVGSSHKEVMSALGQKYREQKAAVSESDKVAGVEDVVKALEVVSLDSD